MSIKVASPLSVWASTRSATDDTDSYGAPISFTEPFKPQDACTPVSPPAPAVNEKKTPPQPPPTPPSEASPSLPRSGSTYGLLYPLGVYGFGKPLYSFYPYASLTSQPVPSATATTTTAITATPATPTDIVAPATPTPTSQPRTSLTTGLFTTPTATAVPVPFSSLNTSPPVFYDDTPSSKQPCAIRDIAKAVSDNCSVLPFLKQARDSYVEAATARCLARGASSDVFQALQTLFPSKQHRWHEWTRLLASEGIETVVDLTNLSESELEETGKKWPVVLTSGLKKLRKGPQTETGRTSLTQASLPTPTSFKKGEYVSERILGRGQFGSAHLVRGPMGLVVLKLITTTTKDERNQAWKEARAMACIPKSEHLVQVLDFFEEDFGICIVMSYCSGGTVQDLVEKRVPADEVARMVWEIASGLQVLHSNSMVHRDVKPDNIFLTETNKIRIGDFGLTRTSGETGYIYSFGCRPYMAPELRMTQMSPASDMWALGCVAIGLLTGQTMEARHQGGAWVLGALPPSEISDFVDTATAGIRGHPMSSVLEGLLHPDHHQRLSAVATVAALSRYRPEMSVAS